MIKRFTIEAVAAGAAKRLELAPVNTLFKIAMVRFWTDITEFSDIAVEASANMIVGLQTDDVITTLGRLPSEVECIARHNFNPKVQVNAPAATFDIYYDAASEWMDIMSKDRVFQGSIYAYALCSHTNTTLTIEIDMELVSGAASELSSVQELYRQ